MASSLENVARAILSAIGSATSLTHIAIIAGASSVLFAVVPEFLFGNHDGQNVYAQFSGAWKWRATWLELMPWNPMSGMGSTFWPVNPYLSPVAWPFAIFSSPFFRIWGVMVAAAVTCFASVLFFLRAASISNERAFSTATITTVALLLMTPDFRTGVDIVVPISYAFVSLALLAKMSSARSLQALGWGILFFISSGCWFLAHPAWVILGLPVVGVVVCAILLGGGNRIAILVAISGIAISVLVSGAFLTISSLILDTARVAFSGDFAGYERLPYLAGHLFRPSVPEVTWVILIILGLRPALMRRLPAVDDAVIAASAWLYCIIALVGIVFIYGPWPENGPKPSYMFLFAYPLGALVATFGAERLLRPSDIARDVTTLVVFSVFLAWHVWQGNVEAVVVAVALVASGVWAYRKRPGSTAAVLIVVCLFILQQKSSRDFAGRNSSWSPSFRMAMVPNPLTEFLREKLEAQPGDGFAGYVDDYYLRGQIPSKQLISRFVTDWAYDWSAFGHGMKLFTWNLSGIPTTSIYSPYIDPLYYLFTRSLLGHPDEKPALNYVGLTKVNYPVLALMGVRYIVTDDAQLQGKTVLDWKGLRIISISSPNLGTYSPTEVIPARGGREMISRIDDPSFDGQVQVVVDQDIAASMPRLVRATHSSVSTLRGSIRVSALSEGTSLLVLPFNHSFCWQVPPPARLIRVNLIQVGLLFSNRAEVTLRRRGWPSGSSACHSMDRQDHERLLRFPGI